MGEETLRPGFGSIWVRDRLAWSSKMAGKFPFLLLLVFFSRGNRSPDKTCSRNSMTPKKEANVFLFQWYILGGSSQIVSG